MTKYTISGIEVPFDDPVVKEAIIRADNQMQRYCFESAASGEVLESSLRSLACLLGVLHAMKMSPPTDDELNDLAFLIHGWTIASFRDGKPPELPRIDSE